MIYFRFLRDFVALDRLSAWLRSMAGESDYLTALPASIVAGFSDRRGDAFIDFRRGLKQPSRFLNGAMELNTFRQIADRPRVHGPIDRFPHGMILLLVHSGNVTGNWSAFRKPCG